jgi:alpha-mannosidase
MRNLYVISHTHWDREWYRPFQSFRLKLVHLIDGMLDILEHDREFKHFMLDGQTIILDDYLYMRPEKEAVLREHIRKGRILIGPWHILPDMFLVGPEAHVRNLLQGDRTARKFGHKMMIGYMPDSFGHIGQIPQILRGFGMETASLWRGVDDGPTEFWWQAPDGSRVLMAYLREGYGNGADLPADNLELFTKTISEKGDALARFSTTSDQLIMYGTDHMEPPRNTSEAIGYADEMLRDTHVIHSTLPDYVAAVKTAIEKQNRISRQSSGNCAPAGACIFYPACSPPGCGSNNAMLPARTCSQNGLNLFRPGRNSSRARAFKRTSSVKKRNLFARPGGS